MIVQLFSIAGALMILAAFFLQQLGRWRATDLPYLWANLAGSGILTAVAWLESQWGFLLLEAAWAAVSVYGLAARRRPAGP